MRDWLVQTRKALGWSQYKAADEIGISQSYYAAIELGDRGKHMPGLLAKKIAQVMQFEQFGFDWTRFYGD